ncbi:MAG: acylphosphatase [Methanobacteriota archaeon]
MIRARITVGGKVQRVGYREKVQEAARELGIAGRARNLKSGEVEIVCEGEKQGVEKFIKAIEIKDGLIEVKKITTTFEEPTGELKHFEIGYGDIQEELTESIGAGRRELIAVRESVDAGFSKMDSNFETLGNKIDTVGKNVVDVGEKIDTGFAKTDSNFKDLDSKYDVVSKELRAMNENISKLAAHIGSLVEEFIKEKKSKGGKTVRRKL